ncbi:cathepsin, partial [Cichlidogyrus casuarinus]
MAKLLRVPDIRLSVQYVIDCGLQHKLRGCFGGSEQQVYSFINVHGIIESQYYNYSAREGTCNLTPFQKTKILRPSINYTGPFNIKAQDVKKILHHSGPVVIAFDAEPLEFFLYGSGVLETSCGPGSSSNHAVALMGYGLDEATNKEYILLQNSMGSTWGENGFFRMPLDKNICSIYSRWVIIKNVSLSPSP